MNSSVLSTDINLIIILIAIFAATICLRIAITSSKSDLHINKPIGVIGLYLSAFCLVLCVLSTKLGTIETKTIGNPSDTVSSFYDSIISEDWDLAYSYLIDCKSLGLEDELVDDKLANALEKSYSYSISENAVISGLTASQKISFTYLDLSSIEQKVSTYIEPLLNSRIETLSKNDLYTDDGHYQASLMNDIYDEALDNALKYVEDYYVTEEYEITLNYKNGQWYINTNEQMIKGFLGGQY